MAFEDFSVEKLAARTPPARMYLWAVDLIPPGVGGDPSVLTLQARSCTIPGLTNNEITIPYMNSEFYIAGRRTWETFDIMFMENELGEVYKVFYDWCNKIYNVDGFGEGGVPRDYKARLDITRLTVAGATIDEFIVYGAWPTTIGTIDMAYDNEEIQTMTVTFRFDFWSRLTGAGVIGQLEEVYRIGKSLTGLL
jgi:hypothetical protein